MSGAPTVFVEDFNKIIDECTNFACITRDGGLQRQAISRLDELLSEIAAEKSTAISANNEDYANLLLGCECVARGIAAEIKMWLLLKEGRPDAAWDQLVTAQTNIADAPRAHKGFSHLTDHVERLNAIEQLVFPPQVYLSTGFIVQKQICSPCENDYEDCGHIKGHPYMGKFCTVRLIPSAVDHVAFVENPANKRCRVLTFSAEGGYRNRMTWLVEPRTNPKEEANPDFKAECIVACTLPTTEGSPSNDSLAISEPI